jgi:hypothetical protein
VATQQQVRSGPGPTTAALAAMKAQQTGQPVVQPFRMPEVEQGDVVLYQDGLYNPRGQTVSAVVMTVLPESLELGVFQEGTPNIRLLGSSVRHKDDPEVKRIAQINANAEERESFGVWFRSPSMFTPTERKRLKVLLSLYQDELDEFAKSGTIRGKSPNGPANGQPPAGGTVP